MVQTPRGMIRAIVVGALLTACGSSPKKASDPAPRPTSTAPAPSPSPETPTPSASGSTNPPPAGSCTVGSLTVTATELSPHDQCNATFYCPGARTVLVSCDGENDGTKTSLCSCGEGGKRASVSGTVPGEGPDSCLAAADRCLVALGP
jgi:hypothetical protein